MQMHIGSVIVISGTSAQVAGSVSGMHAIDVQIAYSGTAGSYTAFVLQDKNN